MIQALANGLGQGYVGVWLLQEGRAALLKEGRVKVFMNGVWIMTVIPGHLMCLDCEAVLLGCEDQGQYCEERTTWGGVMCALSEFQQTGEVPCMDDNGFIYE